MEEVMTQLIMLAHNDYVWAVIFALTPLCALVIIAVWECMKAHDYAQADQEEPTEPTDWEAIASRLEKEQSSSSTAGYPRLVISND